MYLRLNKEELYSMPVTGIWKYPWLCNIQLMNSDGKKELQTLVKMSSNFKIQTEKQTNEYIMSKRVSCRDFDPKHLQLVVLHKYPIPFTNLEHYIRIERDCEDIYSWGILAESNNCTWTHTCVHLSSEKTHDFVDSWWLLAVQLA